MLRKFLTLLFMSILSINVFADDRYASRMTQDGFIYFISPHKLDKTTRISDFEYDMTCLTWTDSVTVNFTYKSKSILLPEELSIMSCGKEFACHEFKTLFTDIVKGGYEIRISSIFSCDDIKDIINCKEPPVFVLSKGGIEYTATYSKGGWRKDSGKLVNIFNLYLFSKQNN